jgi:hypothetical protein
MEDMIVPNEPWKPCTFLKRCPKRGKEKGKKWILKKSLKHQY